MKRLLLFWTIVLWATHGLYAQTCGVAFYNVENLFDTIPSPFYDDTKFTPQGIYRWDTEKYRNKLKGLARVLDEIRADVVGLAEVENEEVVRDLVRTLQTDYCYIHHTSNDHRGIDLAFLYKGDRFEVKKSWLTPSYAGREFLNVKGLLMGDSIQFIVCHLPSVFNTKKIRDKALSALEYHVKLTIARNPNHTVVVMGDMNREYTPELQKRLGYQAPLHKFDSLGYGSYYIQDQWKLIDNIFVCNGQDFCVSNSGIYIQAYMLHRTQYGRQPFRTFGSNYYIGGISDHLPVYVILDSQHGLTVN